MDFTNISKKLSLMTIAGYVLLFAVAAKVVHVYATHHPSKEELFRMNGVVHQVHLGGQGTSTYFLVDSNDQVQQYSSYYGIVWPGMEKVKKGDSVSILAERNKLKKGQFLTGKVFWIWEMTKGNDFIVKYEDVLDMVTKDEINENTYVNYLLYVAIVLFLFAYIRKGLSSKQEKLQKDEYR